MNISGEIPQNIDIRKIPVMIAGIVIQDITFGGLWQGAAL